MRRTYSSETPFARWPAKTNSLPSGESARLAPGAPDTPSVTSVPISALNRTGDDTDGLRQGAHIASATAKPALSAAASAQGSVVYQPERDCAPTIPLGALNPVPEGASASSISSCASEMSASRRFRSFSRLRCSSLRIEAGVVGGSASHGGDFVRTKASVSETSSPSKARLPVSISNRTHPNAQMSLRLSAGRPFACSGDM